jgi:poly(A) polymerase
MFLDPLTGEIHDYVAGRSDLDAKILRAIGDPHARIAEDKLRMLRAVRFAARFNLALDPATAAAIIEMSPQIGVVSAERIADEFRKLLTDPNRARGMQLLLDTHLAERLLPEIMMTVGLPQGPPDAPTGDLWTHTLRVLDLLGPKPSFPLALAALLHDVGKPRTVGRTENRYTFYGHEHVGKLLTEDVALRLKLSNEERLRTAWLVEKHQILADVRQMRTSKVKVLLAHPGILELLDLHRADARATGRPTDHVEYCEMLLREWTTEDLDPPPLLTGHDLTRKGLQPGPLFKRLLDALREAQLDGTVSNTKQAWELVEKSLQDPSSPKPST